LYGRHHLVAQPGSPAVDDEPDQRAKPKCSGDDHLRVSVDKHIYDDTCDAPSGHAREYIRYHAGNRTSSDSPKHNDRCPLDHTCRGTGKYIRDHSCDGACKYTRTDNNNRVVAKQLRGRSISFFALNQKYRWIQDKICLSSSDDASFYSFSDIETAVLS
jgi:hypothetical protein